MHECVEENANTHEVEKAKCYTIFLYYTIFTLKLQYFKLLHQDAEDRNFAHNQKVTV